MPDPNNHVPEVSPADAWGDEEVPVLDPANPGAFLPARRAVKRIEPVGLRIEVKPVPSPAEPDAVTRLEVQEIGGGVLRLEKEAPGTPKVERQMAVKSEGVVPREEPIARTEDMSWGAAHPQSLRWLVIGGLIVIVLIVLGLLALPRLNRVGTSKSLVPPAMPVFDDADDPQDLREIERMLVNKGVADRVLADYAAATEVSQVLPLLRDGDLLAATIRRNWRPWSVPAGWKVPADALWAGMRGDGMRYEVMAGALPDHTSFTAFFVTRNDRLVLDWKATTGFGTAAFEELEKGRGDGAEIRGNLALADFYTYAYPESEFQSYRLKSPSGETAVWCYARRGSLADEAVGPLLRAGEIVTEVEKETRATVSLQRAGTDALPNQWLLVELLHNDWVSP